MMKTQRTASDDVEFKAGGNLRFSWFEGGDVIQLAMARIEGGEDPEQGIPLTFCAVTVTKEELLAMQAMIMEFTTLLVKPEDFKN